MTEPEQTDHRAEAERYLTVAAASVDEGAEGFAQAEALIGIGHALLALGGPEKPTAIVHLAGNATREQIRDALRQPHPPLSPSEG